MANTNALEGIACPQCGQEGTFEIQASTWATVTDDGTDSLTDTEWDKDSSIICSSCHHQGTVGEFTIEAERTERLDDIVLYFGVRSLRATFGNDTLTLRQTPEGIVSVTVNGTNYGTISLEEG